LPAFTGPVVLGSNVFTIQCWLFIVVFSSILSHSGYALPFLPSPILHEIHHLKGAKNYGVLGVLDRFHKTAQLKID